MDPVVKQRRMRFVEGVLLDFLPLPFALAEAREHARIWAQLGAAGTLIGERDLLIAATAVANGFAVATLNHGEFGRVCLFITTQVVAAWLRLTTPLTIVGCDGRAAVTVPALAFVF